MPRPSFLGGSLEVTREVDDNHPDEEDADTQFVARRHFPHLSASVAPRESDETPTYWEDA